MIIRDEIPSDIAAIAAVVTAAFASAPHSSGTEASIVDGLRRAGALTISLVAVENEVVVGHIAFSSVTVDGRDVGWFGLGPVAVRSDLQGARIGDALVREGLARLTASGAKGCVLLGDPRYYGRFGFAVVPGLIYPAASDARYFQGLSFGATAPAGEVAYHAAFG